MTDERTILDGPSGAGGQGASPPRIAPPPAFGPSAGDELGPFRIIRTLGEGGFGIVFEAEQRHPVRRSVALKLLKPGIATADVLARFEAERQALARMEHPAVAKVLDAGATPDGRPWFAMEFVRGEPLVRFADDASLGMRDRVELMITACEAVQHAHAKGVVHRDLKPANILCTRTESGPFPKVIDFGIAKATGERLSDSGMATLGGAMMGTPDYMSPEQADGSDIDTRTDVYALGATLYELASGLMPFDPVELRAGGMHALRATLLEKVPPRPSERFRALMASDPATAARIARSRATTPDGLVRLLRDDIDWICLKCLEKLRDRRYDSPGALAEDLRRHLRREPVSAGPPSRAYLVRKYVARHRIAVVAAGAIVALLVASAAVFAWLYREADDQFRRAEAERRLAEDTLAAFQQSVAAADPSTGQVTAEMRVPEFLGFVEQELDRRLAGQPDALASLRTTLGLVQLSFRDRAGALRLLKPVLDERLAAAQATPTPQAMRELGNAYHNWGRALYLAESWNDAFDAYGRALEIRRNLAGDGADADVAMTLQHLASVERMRGHPEEAVRLIDASIELWTRLDRFSLERAKAVNNRGVILHRSVGDLAGAERDYLDALHALEPRLGSDDLSVATTYANLGDLLRERGRLDDAEAAQSKALDIRRRRLGPQHAQTLRTEQELGRTRSLRAAPPAPAGAPQ
jgi:non-specific serine/threonine protein kinase/serine/threonine-protein kinase